MSGLAIRYNGSNIYYTAAEYTGISNLGTHKLCVRTNGTVLSYPLTTNTSASQYCKFKIKVANSTAYLAKSFSNSSSYTRSTNTTTATTTATNVSTTTSTNTATTTNTTRSTNTATTTNTTKSTNTATTTNTTKSTTRSTSTTSAYKVQYFATNSEYYVANSIFWQMGGATVISQTYSKYTFNPTSIQLTWFQTGNKPSFANTDILNINLLNYNSALRSRFSSNGATLSSSVSIFGADPAYSSVSITLTRVQSFLYTSSAHNYHNGTRFSVSFNGRTSITRSTSTNTTTNTTRSTTTNTTTNTTRSTTRSSTRTSTTNSSKTTSKSVSSSSSISQHNVNI